MPEKSATPTVLRGHAALAWPNAHAHSGYNNDHVPTMYGGGRTHVAMPRRDAFASMDAADAGGKQTPCFLHTASIIMAYSYCKSAAGCAPK